MALYDKLKVAAISLDICQSDKEANINAVRGAIEKFSIKPDIIVLPELWSTGYIADAEAAHALAETTDGETMQFVKGLAKSTCAAICGSFLCEENGNLYNRAFFTEPSGEVQFYDKRHLFVLSKEADITTPGNKLSPIIRFRGWNIAMAVCYDIRFPIWNRNLNLKYDLLLVPANWPQKRAYAWKHLLIARAIENQAYIVGANRGGEDEYGVYDGETYIFDYMGKDIASTKGIITSAALNKNDMENFRKAFPFWKDADML